MKGLPKREMTRINDSGSEPNQVFVGGALESPERFFPLYQFAAKLLGLALGRCVNNEYLVGQRRHQLIASQCIFNIGSALLLLEGRKQEYAAFIYWSLPLGGDAQSLETAGGTD